MANSAGHGTGAGTRAGVFRRHVFRRHCRELIRGDILSATMLQRLFLLILILLVPVRALAADWMAVGHAPAARQETQAVALAADAGSPCAGHSAVFPDEAYDTHQPGADPTPSHALQKPHDARTGCADLADCADESAAGHAGCTSCDICHAAAIATSSASVRAPLLADAMPLQARPPIPEREVPPGLKPPIT